MILLMSMQKAVLPIRMALGILITMLVSSMTLMMMRIMMRMTTTMIY